jgi:glycosyltransferase involved in cell wall biosynthesis
MESFRIAFITFEYPPLVEGGAGVYASGLANELTKLNHEVHVICPQTHNVTSSPSDEVVHRLRSSDLKLLRAPSFWWQVRRQFDRIRESAGGFDLIHSQLMSDVLLDRKIAHNLKRVITVHHLGSDAAAVTRRLWLERMMNLGSETGATPTIERFWIHSADELIAVSEYTKNSIITRHGIESGRISVVYNGINPSDGSFSETELRDFRQSLTDNQSPIVLFVGRIDDPRKGLARLLLAFKMVLSQVDSTLLVVGKGNPERFRSAIKRMGMEHRIVFSGRINQMTLRKAYAASEVYVCPSLLEGFGFTVLEAMQSGKPVVASKVGAIPEILDDGVNGNLVDVDDIPGLANCITKYLTDKEISKEIGDRNRLYVRDRFSWKKCAIGTVESYRRALTS